MKDLIKALFLFHFTDRIFVWDLGLDKYNTDVYLLNWKVGESNTYRYRKWYYMVMVIITIKTSLLDWCINMYSQNLKRIILYHVGSMYLVFWRHFLLITNFFMKRILNVSQVSIISTGIIINKRTAAWILYKN